MRMYIKIIKNQMMKKNMTIENIAKLTQMKESRIVDVLEGVHELTLDELVQFVNILHLNINDVLGTSIYTNDDFVLLDESEIEINRIARKIPKSQRSKFVRAVNYLAECFEFADDKEDF